jgi:GNAT superfamily N-acetyltransferase
MDNSPQRGAALATRRAARAASAQSQQPTVTYTGRGDAQATLARITGRAQVSEAEVARLAGAVGGPDVHVEVRYVGPTSAQLLVTGPGYRSDTWLFDDAAAGVRGMKINYLFLEPSAQGQGLGTRIWATQARQARRLGFTVASLDAGRREVSEATERYPAMTGYDFWPARGFDAPIERAKMDQPLPPSLAGARMVSDLVRTPAGRAWWHEHGSSTLMQFDLHAGSDSWKRLHAALRRLKTRGAP